MNDTPCYSDECALSRIGDFFECVGAKPPVNGFHIFFKYFNVTIFGQHGKPYSPEFEKP